MQKNAGAQQDQTEDHQIGDPVAVPVCVRLQEECGWFLCTGCRIGPDGYEAEIRETCNTFETQKQGDVTLIIQKNRPQAPFFVSIHHTRFS